MQLSFLTHCTNFIFQLFTKLSKHLPTSRYSLLRITTQLNARCKWLISFGSHRRMVVLQLLIPSHKNEIWLLHNDRSFSVTSVL